MGADDEQDEEFEELEDDEEELEDDDESSDDENDDEDGDAPKSKPKKRPESEKPKEEKPPKEELPSPAEVARMRRALKKANTQAKNAREKLAEANKKLSEREDPNDEDVAERYKTEGRSQAEGTWKSAVVRQAARAAFLSAGYSGEDPSKLVKLIEIHDIEVDIDDETGEVFIDGLDEQVDEVKSEWAVLFGKRKSAADEEEEEAPRRRRRPRVDPGDKGGKGTSAKSSAELLAAGLGG